MSHSAFTRVAALLAFAVVLGCSREVVQPADVSVAEAVEIIAAPPVEVVSGETRASYVDVVRTGAITSPLALEFSGLPNGVGVRIDNTFNPLARSQRVAFTLVAAEAAPTGLFDVVVSARLANSGDSRPSSIRVKAAPIQVASVPISPEITLTTSKASLAINRGTSDSVLVTVSRSGTWEDEVSLVVYGMPSGVTATLSQSRLDSWLSTSYSSMRFTVPSGTPPNIYTVIIRAEYVSFGWPAEKRFFLEVR